jgi:hypothetical protein
MASPGQSKLSISAPSSLVQWLRRLQATRWVSLAFVC